jgi:hypothetical protein
MDRWFAAMSAADAAAGPFVDHGSSAEMLAAQLVVATERIIEGRGLDDVDEAVIERAKKELTTEAERREIVRTQGLADVDPGHLLAPRVNLLTLIRLAVRGGAPLPDGDPVDLLERLQRTQDPELAQALAEVFDQVAALAEQSAHRTGERIIDTL